jgi:hypothetical protein
MHADNAHLQREHRGGEEGHHESNGRVDVPCEPGYLFCAVGDEGSLVSMECLMAGTGSLAFRKIERKYAVMPLPTYCCLGDYMTSSMNRIFLFKALSVPLGPTDPCVAASADCALTRPGRSEPSSGSVI